MNEQQIREIAETAFKRQFPDVELARVNVWPGVGFEDDSPVVDVHIIYDGKYEQLNADGLLDAQGEVVDKAYLRCGGRPRLPLRPLLRQVRARAARLDDGVTPCAAPVCL